MKIGLWGFFVGAIAAIYIGAAFRWWARPTVTDLLFVFLLFIFYALVEIAALLERLAPPKETRRGARSLDDRRIP